MIYLIVTADRLLWLRRMNKENTQAEAAIACNILTEWQRSVGQSPSQSAPEPNPRNGESGDTSPIHAPTPILIVNLDGWA